MGYRLLRIAALPAAVIAFFSLALLWGPAPVLGEESGGATYHVAPRGSDDNPGTRARPWRSLEHAGESAEAGDTVIFAPGTYEGRLTVNNSGTADAPIVFRSAERRRARIEGEGGTRVLIEDAAHVTLEGFHIHEYAHGHWLRANDADYLTIRDCRFEGGSKWQSAVISDSRHVRVIDNDFARRDNGSDMLHISAGEHVLIEGNSFTRALHTAAGIHVPVGGSRFVVIRGNVFHSGWSRNLGSAAHPDVLVENNIFTNAYNGARSAGSVNQLTGSRLIARFNQVFRNFGAPWQVNARGASEWHNRHARFYHNVFHDNHGPGLIVVGSQDHFRDAVLKNNVFQDNDPFGSRTQVPWRGHDDSLSVISNAFWAGERGVESLLLVNEDPLSLDEAQDEHELASDHFHDNTEREAGFADPHAFDFSLTEQSPLRDAAAPLTVARSAGQGRELAVEDSYGFYDGFGIEGERGDLIAVGSRDNRARVVEVDHEAGVLHLDRELEWREGARVALPWSGSAPDLGVYEHGDSARPSVQVVASHAFPGSSEEVELTAVTRGIDEPVEYDWHLGDNTRAQGETITHTFRPGYDYGIRVRVTDSEGHTHMGVGYVNAERPQSDDVLIHTTFDADDDDWWTHWQFYRGRRGTGYADREHILDEQTGRGYHHISPQDGTGPIPALLHPRAWDMEKYPRIRIRYRIEPGSPVAIFVAPFPSAYHVAGNWDFRTDRQRRFFLAGTEAEPRGDRTLIDDGQWHEVSFDLAKVREHWPDVEVLQALNIGDVQDFGGATVEEGHAFWLDEIYIGK